LTPNRRVLKARNPPLTPAERSAAVNQRQSIRVGTAAAAGRPSRILAVDLGAISGSAFLTPGDKPLWRSENFTFVASPYDSGLPTRPSLAKTWPTAGRVLARTRNWLDELIRGTEADLLVLEAPFIAVKFNNSTIRQLYGFAAIAAELADRNGICYLEVTTPKVCKFFTGKGAWGGRDAKKAATIRMCGLYGFNTATTDESDAIAVALYAEAILYPQIAADRGVGPLFLKTD